MVSENLWIIPVMSLVLVPIMLLVVAISVCIISAVWDWILDKMDEKKSN